MAFVTALPLSARATAPLSSRAPRMTASRPSPSRDAVSRRGLLRGLGAAVVGAGALAAGAPAANAGLEYGLSKALFPKEGFTKPEPVLPSSVSVDRSVLESKEGAAAVKAIQEVSVLVKKANADFEKAPEEFDVSAAFKVFKIDELRSALNTVTPAFDEDTQKKTDKVVRSILQDINELTFNGTIRPGTKRTVRKMDRIRGWISKIDGDLDYLVAFFK